MLWMITAERPDISEEAHARRIVSLAEAGLSIVTLRPTAFPEKDAVRRVTMRLKREVPDLTVLVRGDPSFASRCGADGIHLASRDIGKVLALRRSDPMLRLAVSTHMPTEFERAFTDGADLALYGPVFPPFSKPDDARPTVTPVMRPGLFLIGGIDRHRAERLIAQGFRDLAAISLFYSQTACDEVRFLDRLMREVTP